MFGAAAAAVLVVSFAVLAARLDDAAAGAAGASGRCSGCRSPPTSCSARSASLVFALTVYAGPGRDRHRAATTSRRPWSTSLFWVGVPFASLLLGDVWPAAEPVAGGRPASAGSRARVGGDELPEPLPYPERLGRWPAAAGRVRLRASGAVLGDGARAARARGAAARLLRRPCSSAWASTASRRGRATPTRSASTSACSRAWRRSRGATARSSLRPPLVGAPRSTPLAGHRRACCSSAIGVDRVRRRQARARCSTTCSRTCRTSSRPRLLAAGTALELGFVVGLLVFDRARLADLEPRRSRGCRACAARGPARGASCTRSSRSLAAYVVAHYFSLLAYNGQDLARLASDPLGDGSDLFGTAGATIDYGVVSATAIWYVQVGALVLGHVAALVLAHDRALSVYGGHRDATRSQLVMLVAHGRASLPRALAALGGERMTVPPSRTPATGSPRSPTPCRCCSWWIGSRSARCATRRDRADRRARGRRRAPVAVAGSAASPLPIAPRSRHRAIAGRRPTRALPGRVCSWSSAAPQTRGNLAAGCGRAGRRRLSRLRAGTALRSTYSSPRRRLAAGAHARVSAARGVRKPRDPDIRSACMRRNRSVYRSSDRSGTP